MRARKVVAIVRRTALEKVEEALRDLGVAGMTVSTVKGYGDYAKLSRGDWLVDNARIEVFTFPEKVDDIVQTILDTAHVGALGDGMVAVLPVERLYSVRTKAEVLSKEP